MEPQPGLPYPLGAHLGPDGTNFAVSSEIADAVEVCLFTEDGSEERIELPRHTGHIWHGHLPGVDAGRRYGLRVHGPWEPKERLRCNPAKLLLDPHATAVEGEVRWGEAVFGHRFDAAEERNDDDSAPSMPRCVVTSHRGAIPATRMFLLSELDNVAISSALFHASSGSTESGVGS